ncbi:DNA polymerase III subunit beta [Micromonospora sp. WMMD1102]|uniref:DNA polymerase III subunit beta n=1 Tax=Micromonospora sp. WMMD1102 TaxID=3016105 RepID=UPI0024156E44|nr:DNA polymerase III subunit beta [Micromonospora sp. WMMD1102]MDG4791972.1 DNA polymerase III subunit beta [Micromonospora sp. WMMD1102]
MKLRVAPHALGDAAGWVAKSLPNRPSVPVLAGVLLRAVDGGLQVSGYDYDRSARDTVPADVAEGGAALVSGRLLAEIAKALPAKPVDITSVGAHLELVCGSARFTLPTMPVEDYPALPDLPGPAGTIDAAEFAAAVAQVAVAAGRDETLPMMTGVRVEIEGDRVALLATDRYRLAVREFEWQPDDAGLSATALVPAQTLADTAKTLAQQGGQVRIHLGESGQGEGVVGFSGTARHTTSRLLDGGNYPPVRTLFPDPDKVTSHATVTVATLIEVVKRVSLVGGKTTPVLLTFAPDGLTVEAGGTEEARASEAMDVTFTGDTLTIGFNPAYLVDGLTALGSVVARFEFVDAFKPAVITPADEGGESVPGYRYLIMPIRVSR